MGFNGGVVCALEDVENVDAIRELFEVRVERVLELGGVVDGVGCWTRFEVVLE